MAQQCNIAFCLSKNASAFFLLLFLAFSSCVKEQPRNSLPYAPVNFKIDVLTDKIDFFSYATFEHPRLADEYVGYGGLLVFTDQNGSVFAYDLCCPHEKNRAIKVKPNNAGEAVCAVCGSKFDIMTGGLGFVKSGPSTSPLQSYSVLQVSDIVYRVRN